MVDAVEIVGDAGSVAAAALSEAERSLNARAREVNGVKAVAKTIDVTPVPTELAVRNNQNGEIDTYHPGPMERASKRSILNLARLCVRLAGQGSLVLDPLFTPIRKLMQRAKLRRRALLHRVDGGRRAASLVLSYSPSHLALPYELKLAEELEEEEEEEESYENSAMTQKKKKSKHRGTRVLIVGGGIGGLKVFHELKAKFQGQEWLDITIVDDKVWHEYTPGILREIVRDSGSLDNIANRFPQDDPDYCRGRVIEVREDCVRLDDGRELGFELLVLASGSRYDKATLPNGFSKRVIKYSSLTSAKAEIQVDGGAAISRIQQNDTIVSATDDAGYSQRAAGILSARKELEQSKRILIVGGGLVGVEMAAELADRYGDEKEITLLHSGKRLCPSLPEASTKYIDSFFQRRGVKVITGAHMLSLDEHSCTYTVGASSTVGTDAPGTLYNDVYASEPSSAATQPEETNPAEQYKVLSLQFDLCVECTGTTPNSDMMLPWYSSAVDDSGHVRVNDLLQIELSNGRAVEHIFAIGDVSGHAPSKRLGGNGLYADLQAGVVVHNIATLLELDMDEDSVHNYLSDDAHIESLFMHFPESLTGSFVRCPRSSVCSLGEIDASMQVEHLVLNGFSAAIAKLLVDELQLLKSQGNPLGRFIYKLSDKVLCYLFREDGGLLKHPRRAIPSFSF